MSKRSCISSSAADVRSSIKLLSARRNRTSSISICDADHWVLSWLITRRFSTSLRMA